MLYLQQIGAVNFAVALVRVMVATGHIEVAKEKLNAQRSQEVVGKGQCWLNVFPLPQFVGRRE